MNDLERFLGALDGSGIDQAILADSGTAHMMVSGHQLLSQRQIPGLELASESTADGIRIAVRVLPNVRLVQPLHLCFGVLHATGRQFVETRLTLEEGAALRVVAHCFFPNAEQVEHRMAAAIAIGPGGNCAMTRVTITARMAGSSCSRRPASRSARVGSINRTFP